MHIVSVREGILKIILVISVGCLVLLVWIIILV